MRPDFIRCIGLQFHVLNNDRTSVRAVRECIIIIRGNGTSVIWYMDSYTKAILVHMDLQRQNYSLLNVGLLANPYPGQIYQQ